MIQKRSAFTLIELMLVVAIMAILATVLISSIRSVKRQAQSTLCQTHLRNLQQGVMNHFAEWGSYPFAGSYEYYVKQTGTYELKNGWVGWILRDESADHSLIDNEKQSRCKLFRYVGCGIDDETEEVRRSIREGSLFTYMRKDYSTYLCKQFRPKGASFRSNALRTFAMNNFFGSRTNPRRDPVLPRDLVGKEASRLALFVSLDEPGGGKLAQGVDGYGDSVNKHAGENLCDDSSWDWQGREGEKAYGYEEDFGAWHRKGKEYYGHVIFLDGHVESIPGKGPKPDAAERERIREKSRALGYGDVK